MELPYPPYQKWFRDTHEFLNEKSRREKREKKIFLCKLNIKYYNAFYTDIYIYIYIHFHKCVRLFKKNNTFICWTKLKTEKRLGTEKQLSQRTLFAV